MKNFVGVNFCVEIFSEFFVKVFNVSLSAFSLQKFLQIIKKYVESVGAIGIFLMEIILGIMIKNFIKN